MDNEKKRIRNEAVKAEIMKNGKRCCRCEAVKPYSGFASCRHSILGIVHRCKECDAKAAKERYHADVVAARSKVNSKQSKWRKENPIKAKAMARRRMESLTPQDRANRNLRKKFREILKAGMNSTDERLNNFVGCSPKFLFDHIERQFKRGMTWANYGAYWHIDHIIPCAAFNQSDPRQVRQCWHFTNLQPLRAKENISKGDRITLPQMSLCL